MNKEVTTNKMGTEPVGKVMLTMGIKKILLKCFLFIRIHANSPSLVLTCIIFALCIFFALGKHNHKEKVSWGGFLHDSYFK